MINVLTKDNEVVGFPDTMSVDEMKVAISDDKTGTISQYKPTFYDRVVRPALEASGMDIFQPKFITQPQPTVEETLRPLKNAGWNFLAGVNQSVAEINKTLGVDQIPYFKDLIKTSEEQNLLVKDYAKGDDNFTRFVNRFAEQAGGLVTSLPAYEAAGAVTVAGLSGKILPIAEKYLKLIPEFAIGMGEEAAIKSAREKSMPEALVAGAEATAMGTVYGSMGNGIQLFPKMIALNVAETSYNALKEDRFATADEIKMSVADGFAWAVAFNVVGSNPGSREFQETFNRVKEDYLANPDNDIELTFGLNSIRHIGELVPNKAEVNAAIIKQAHDLIANNIKQGNPVIADPIVDQAVREHIKNAADQVLTETKVAPSGMTSEDMVINQEKAKGMTGIAMMQDGKVYSYRYGQDGVMNHADVVVKDKLDPKKAIPGFINEKGEFVYQYPEDVGKGQEQGISSIQEVAKSKEDTIKLIDNLANQVTGEKPKKEPSLAEQELAMEDQIVEELKKAGYKYYPRNDIWANGESTLTAQDIEIEAERRVAEASKMTKKAPQKAPGAPGEGGKPWSYVLYQGRGKARKDIYNPGFAEIGPALGEAEYYAFNANDAKLYGANVKEHKVELKNPLIISNDDIWRDITKKAGTYTKFWDDFDFETGKPNTERIREARDKVVNYIKGQGYDGVIVMMERGFDTEAIGKLFGHNQVIKFPEMKKEDLPKEKNKEIGPSSSPIKEEKRYVVDEELSKTIDNLSTQDLEKLIDKRYESGASQNELDFLEGKYADRISEEELNMSEAGPQGADLENALAHDYSEYLLKERKRSGYMTDAELIGNMRGNLENFPGFKGGTDEQVLAAAKDVYERKQSLKKRREFSYKILRKGEFSDYTIRESGGRYYVFTMANNSIGDFKTLAEAEKAFNRQESIFKKAREENAPKKISKKDLETLRKIKDEIAGLQPGYKYVNQDKATGETVAGYQPSEFEYLGYWPKGTSVKSFEAALKAAENGKTTEKQGRLIRDLLDLHKEVERERAKAEKAGVGKPEIDEAERIGEEEAIDDFTLGEGQLNLPGMEPTALIEKIKPTMEQQLTQEKPKEGDLFAESKKQEFNVGDVLDPQGKTNMVGKVTIREIKGNTLKFTDSKGTEFAGMSKSTVRNLLKEGSWKKASSESGQVIIPISEETIAGAKEIARKTYAATINRMQAIEDLIAKAKELGADIPPGEDAGKLAREYLGLGRKVESVLEFNTIKNTPEGKIEVTGEGLKPIYKEYEKMNGDKNALKDLEDYQIAMRTIEDLQRPKADYDPSFIATPEQVAASEQILADLREKYGNLDLLESYAKRLYAYRARVAHMLVDSGVMKKDAYAEMLRKNPHYVSFERILVDVEEPPAGGTPVSKNRFSGMRSPLKKIKGSDLGIQNTIESDIKNTYRIMDIAERNNIARAVAKLEKTLPLEQAQELGLEDMPITMVPVATVEHRGMIDPVFQGKLAKLAVSLGAKPPGIETTGILGKTPGVYYPGQKKITRKLGAFREIQAHESGHFFDDKYGLKERFYKRGKSKAIAEEMLAHMERMGESENRMSKTEERFADAFEWWLVNRDLAEKRDLPLFSKEMEKIIKEIPDLKPLLDIRPEPSYALEKMKKKVFIQSQFKPKGNVIEYFDEGKRKWLKVSPDVYEAMTGLNESSVNMLTKILSIPAQTLRVGATITPEFIFRNPIRDQWTAFMQTNVGFTPFIDTGKAVADIIGKSEAYKDWLRSGGAYSGFVELSRPELKKKVNQLLGNESLLSKLNIVTKAQDISQLMEQATRLAVYKAGVKKGLSPVEAGFMSREATVDFGRRGAKTKDINSAIAFFNAGVQATDVMMRTFAKDPIGTTVKGIATITIPSVISYMLNKDDPEYKEIPRWQKDLFWIFKVGDNFWRIPKPFAYGQVFGSTVERFLEYAHSKDPHAFDEYMKNLYNSLTPGSGDLAGGLLATGIRPLIENATNWNFFRQRPLVPEGKARLLPKEQYTKYTSETAKVIGDIVNYSPAKIDNLITGFFGGSGKYMTDVIDKAILAISGGSKERRPAEFSDLPLVRGFAVRPPESQSESVNQFYKNRDNITAAYESINRNLKEGNVDEVKKLRKEYPEYIYYKAFTNASDLLSDIDKRESFVMRSNKSDEEKRKLLKALDHKKVLIAQGMNGRV